MPIPGLDPSYVRFYALLENGVPVELVLNYVDDSGKAGFTRARAHHRRDLQGLTWKRLDDREEAVTCAATFLGVDPEDTVLSLETRAARHVFEQS